MNGTLKICGLAAILIGTFLIGAVAQGFDTKLQDSDIYDTILARRVEECGKSNPQARQITIADRNNGLLSALHGFGEASVKDLRQAEGFPWRTAAQVESESNLDESLALTLANSFCLPR